jgi:hypothetical protein
MNVMLLSICAFRENMCREDYTFLTGVNEITCTLKLCYFEYKECLARFEAFAAVVNEICALPGFYAAYIL